MESETNSQPAAPDAETPAPAARGRRKLRIALGCVLVPLLVIWLLAALCLDGVAKHFFVKDCSAVLGTEVSIGDVSVSLLRGEVVMEDMRIRNVEGFKTEYIARAGRVQFRQKLWTTWSDMVEIPLVSVEDAEFNIEFANGTHNLAVLDKQMQAIQAASGKEHRSDPQKCRMGLIRIRRAKLNLIDSPLGGLQPPPLDMELRDVVDDYLLPDELLVRAVHDVAQKVDSTVNAIPAFLKGKSGAMDRLFGKRKEK